MFSAQLLVAGGGAVEKNNWVLSAIISSYVFYLLAHRHVKKIEFVKNTRPNTGNPTDHVQDVCVC